MTKTCVLALGNQLFDPDFTHEYAAAHFYMREDVELCVHFKYHKLKISLFLNAMRSYADELRALGRRVTYQKLEPSNLTYEVHFANFLREQKIERVILFEIEDKFFEDRVLRMLKSLEVEIEVLRSPMFLTSRTQFKTYLDKTKKPFMRTFYEAQRKRLKVMVDRHGQPLGGRWSFDELNRKPLPAKVHPPLPDLVHDQPHAEDIAQLCENYFPNHPGVAGPIWFATTREGARSWFNKFLEERFANFGPYEDALSPRSDFVFHSVLTPYLNTGLLTPKEIVRDAIKFANRRKLNISSVEGFVRQIIGWREFIRGIYQNYSERQDRANFFKHERRLTEAWYDGSTGIEPLDHVIKKVVRYGYAHHIERLMVVGNLMLLCEVQPREAHRWFMEMFIDSSDWVMGPNVYGMGIFSDGGIFATKPYICGSNYYRKMGAYRPAPWCDGVDGLYWNFVDRHADYFVKNPRLSMAVRLLEKMDPKKRRRLFAAGHQLRDRITTPKE